MDVLRRRGNMVASAISVLEIFRGCRSLRQEQAAEDIFSRIAVVAVTGETARTGASLMRTHPGVFSSERAAADAMIAATAVTSESILVTLKTRQFARAAIPGLDVIVLDQDAADWVGTVG